MTWSTLCYKETRVSTKIWVLLSGALSQLWTVFWRDLWAPRSAERLTVGGVVCECVCSVQWVRREAVCLLCGSVDGARRRCLARTGDCQRYKQVSATASQPPYGTHPLQLWRTCIYQVYVVTSDFLRLATIRYDTIRDAILTCAQKPT